MIRQIFNSQITEVTTSPRDRVGALRWAEDKLYRYVKLLQTGGTVSGVAGDPVAYVAGGGGVDGESAQVVLRLAEADAQPVCAGFLTASVAGVANTSYYCWVQLSGVVTVPTAITSGVVGRPVMLTTTNKTLSIAAESDSAAAYKAVVGVQISAAGANNKIIARVWY